MKHVRVLSGKDSFRRYQRVRDMKHAFTEKFPEADVHEVGSEDGVGRLEELLFTSSLFSGRKMIITEDFWVPDNFQQAKDKDLFEKVETMGEEVTIIINEGTVKKNTKAGKFFTSGRVKHELFDVMTPAQAREWVLKQDGAKILIQKTASALVERCGTDSGRLWNAYQKLMSYADGEQLTVEDIEATTQAHAETEIWAFLHALSAQDGPKAISQLGVLRGMGQSVYQILPMVMRELRIHVMLRACLDEGRDTKATKLSPFVVKKTIKMTKKFSLGQLKKLHGQVRALDKGMKTGVYQPRAGDERELELALERILLSLGEG